MDDLMGMGIDTGGFASPDLFSGDPGTAGAAGVPSAVTMDQLPGDVSDQQAMGQWNPAARQGAPWWAGIAAYGISRAIDNQFPNSPTGIMGNTYPGSGMGANGRTFSQRPTGSGGGVVRAGIKSPIGQLNFKSDPLLLILLVAGAYLILK